MWNEKYIFSYQRFGIAQVEECGMLGIWGLWLIRVSLLKSSTRLMQLHRGADSNMQGSSPIPFVFCKSLVRYELECNAIVWSPIDANYSQKAFIRFLYREYSVDIARICAQLLSV